MCDTQVMITPDAVWFAKNSDREPSEPQPVIRRAAVRDDSERMLRTTYVEIPQVPERHAVMLSKPAWCWGAEMGINGQGVCIGNQAIFSRTASAQPALLGMDLVRLGLERGGSAQQALDVITELLTRYGQGGPAGYQDKRFVYDNSFLIADAREAFVLETAARDWAARRVQDHYAISNVLTLGRDYDRCSPALAEERPDFAQRFDTWLMPFFAGSRRRRALSLACLAQDEPASLARFARHLRSHRRGNEDPLAGSNGDVCMHAAGFLRRSQTTGSMIARLSAQGMSVVFTGTSAPCLSIYRPAAFEGEFHVLTPEAEEIAAALWRRHELLHRWALADPDLRHRLRRTRDEVEAQVFEQLEAPVPGAAQLMRADRLAAAWHKVLFESLDSLPVPRPTSYWLDLGRRDGIDITRRHPEPVEQALAGAVHDKETSA